MADRLCGRRSVLGRNPCSALVGAAASPRCALRTVMVTAPIATGPSLPQSLRLRACCGLRARRPCGRGDPRLALQGQPAPRAAISARPKPLLHPCGSGGLAAMRTSHCDGHRTDRDGAVAPTIPALEASRGLRARCPCGIGGPRLALHGRPAPRAASTARPKPLLRPCGSGGLAAMRTSHCDGHRTDRDGAVAPTVPALEGSQWSQDAPPLWERRSLQQVLAATGYRSGQRPMLTPAACACWSAW
jgi:hypothetical protein